MDDVVLFGLGTLEEWLYFEVILETFCLASGMCISIEKSGFLFNDQEEGVLNSIRLFLPYSAKPLHVGFKYSGYYINPLGYEVKEWHWLLKRFEKRIGNWSYKFLSLGGRLVLIRDVLTSLLAYWFALALIHVSILNKMRQLIFSFLWGSNKNKFHFHLVDWQTLERPFC